VIVVGVFGDKPVVDMGTVQDRELRLVGALITNSRIGEGDRAHRAGEGRSRAPGHESIRIRDYQKAYEYIDANRERAMKVMIVVDA